jgi:hypothetical protein
MSSQPVEAYPRLSVRRWVPFVVVVGLFVATGVASGLAGSLAPEPHGHWTGHLTNATTEIGTLATVAVGTLLAWSHFGHLVVKVLAGAALAAVMVGLVLETIGNLRVAQSIWRTPYGDEDVAQFGSTFSGFDSGHDLAATGDGLVLLGGLAFALVLGFSRRVGIAAAVAGVVLSLVPPWMIPALGVVFLLAVLLRPRH